MSDFDISIDRTSLSLPPLVLHGDRQPGWCLMPNFSLPAQIAEMTMASSDELHGEVPTSDRLTNGSFSGDVLPVASSLADLRTLVDELRAALFRRTFAVDESWLGETWTGYRGSLTPSPITWLSVKRNEPVFSLTIPCHPIPGA